MFSKIALSISLLIGAFILFFAGILWSTDAFTLIMFIGAFLSWLAYLKIFDKPEKFEARVYAWFAVLGILCAALFHDGMVWREEQVQKLKAEQVELLAKYEEKQAEAIQLSQDLAAEVAANSTLNARVAELEDEVASEQSQDFTFNFNPTAICNDGTYSYSAHRQGTCSHHGGVRTWNP